MPKELVEYIAQNLVNDPSQVQLREKRTSSSVILELKVAKSDMGRVIGKQGRVANAIRSLLRVVSTKDDIRIILEID
ncbi:MAG: KH domain-containing protein [Anaerolineae bacterium]|mgnify:FL=1|nr:KH domain-containing protein [Anaerolineae bacterium]